MTFKLKNIFQAINQEYRSSTYYKKVLYSYLLISCVIFTSFTIVMLLLTNRDYGNTLEDMQDYTITQAHNVNQTILKDIVNHCYSVLDSTSMSTILYGTYYNNTLGLEAMELNNNIRSTSSLIMSVYFINFQTQTILDHNGRSTISNHMDQEIFDIISELTPGNRPMFCYPRIIDYKTTRVIYYDVPVLTFIFYSNQSGVLAVNLDYNAYRDMLSLGDNEYIDIVMVNSIGKVMSASDSGLFGMDYTENELYRKIQTAPNNRGSFPYQHDGQQDYVSYIKNKGLGITYICSRNTQFVYFGNSALSSLLRYSALYLVIGLLLSLLLSWIIYNPFRQLKTYISHHPTLSSAELLPEKNDFDYLSHAYRKILDINTDLQEVSHAYLKERNQKFMNALLTDTSEIFTQYSSELEALNASLHEKYNQILLLKPDPPSGQPEAQIENSLLKYVIQNVTEELLSSTVSVQHIDIESPFVVFLLNFSEPNSQDIIQCIKEAQAFIRKHYKATFSSGIGEPLEELTELAVSYNSACEAFSRRFVSGNSSIHNAAELNLKPIPEQVYPFEIGDSLLNAVKSLSIKEALEYVHGFIMAVSEYNIEHILCFILQLSSSLQRLEHMNYIAADGAWNYNALEQSTLDTIERELTARCRYDIEELTKIKKTDSGQKELINEVLHLVEDNICNPDLSVAFLADKVHLSVNYLRNIFKDNTGDSLSGYITQKRLDLICDLLLHTDMPLSEISDKLGFSTKNYFFAFVKKHTGMTPGDYRKKMK